MTTPHRRRALLAFVLLLAACASADGDPTALRSDLTPDGTLFLAQSEPAWAVMDALFIGTVERDGQGCLRLVSAGDRATVVWPYRFTLAAREGGLFVRDAAGREIGRVGGSFRFGGGEVTSLHAGVPLPSDQRERAAARCPGRYWIVGDVP